MKFPRNARVFRGQFEAAPYAGVFFILVLMLLLNSSLVYRPGLKLDLPEARDVQAIIGPTLIVAVDSSGLCYYENQFIKEEDLRDRLRGDVLRFKSPVTLVIEADRAVGYEVIVRLGKLARESGVKEAMLATRPSVFPLPENSRAQQQP
ncbi:MAG TPA: biopolymer transporter ExbD [Roseimicrobium sp.]|nr:biopolymer transporter ExbD [Roseimicrobium sp.]